MIFEEKEVLKTVCERLSRIDVPYMITGSIAANCYATPRFTRDIDIVIVIGKDDVDQFVRMFQEDFYIDREMIIDALNHQGMFNILHNHSGVKVDFILRQNSEYRRLEFQRRRMLTMDGIRNIAFVSLEDLIISKLFWAKDSLSEMQLSDIRNLIRQNDTMDRGYMEIWIRELQLEEIYQKVTP